MKKSDLPAGAREYNGKEVRGILDALLEKDVYFQQSGTGAHYATNRPDFLNRFDVKVSSNTKSPENMRLFNGNPIPRIDGSSYYMGMAVKAGEGTVLLYTPWIQKDTPPTQKFRVFTLGEVSDEKVLKIVRTYSDNMMRYIHETQPSGGMKDND